MAAKENPLLVLATSYPRLDGSVESYFIHTRNRYYIENGFKVIVVSLNETAEYEIDGVKVITPATYAKLRTEVRFELCLAHAANIRNHYLFLKKYQNDFKHILFYFHGHEVVRQSEIYPEPFDYIKKDSRIKKMAADLYDGIKVRLWAGFFKKHNKKLHYIFVSRWMLDMFRRYVPFELNDSAENMHIIYNAIGKDFEKDTYSAHTNKEYDFITIRSNLDGSKYCVDLVNKLAADNPLKKFCVIGRGRYFDHYKKAGNIDFMKTNLSHDQIIEYFNKSRFALLLTRTDAQGVMACEAAAFGIPLITSDIDVCREVFEGFKNVALLNNEEIARNTIDLDAVCERLNLTESKNEKYFAKNTMKKEIDLFEKIVD